MESEAGPPAPTAAGIGSGPLLYCASAMNNPYLGLTEELNRGRLRALLSSGQAVVMHRLAIMSKDGDWILDEALDRERRALMRTNEERLARYQEAAASWAAVWPEVQRQIEGLPLASAHPIVTSRAEGVLPFAVDQGGDR
jgi:hypothetical protein